MSSSGGPAVTNKSKDENDTTADARPNPITGANKFVSETSFWHSSVKSRKNLIWTKKKSFIRLTFKREQSASNEPDSKDPLSSDVSGAVTRVSGKIQLQKSCQQPVCYKGVTRRNPTDVTWQNLLTTSKPNFNDAAT